MGNPSPERITVIDPVEFSIRVVVSTELGLADIERDDDIWGAGCDERTAAAICHAISTGHGGSLTPDDLRSARTVAQICELLHTHEIAERSNVVVMNEHGNRTPIFLVAGSGSPALMFHALAAALGADQPLVVLEQFGVHQNAEPDATIAAAADRHLREVHVRQPDGRCIIASYSWGGLAAWTMVARLRADGRDAVFIGVDPMHQAYIRPLSSRVARKFRRLLKLIRREGGVIRAARSRLLPTAIGTTARYDRLYRHGLATAATFDPVRLDAPALVIISPLIVRDHWIDVPAVQHVHLEGDHFAMLLPRGTRRVADTISEFLS